MRMIILAVILISSTASSYAEDTDVSLPKSKPQPLTPPFDEGKAKAAQGAWAKFLGKSSPVEKSTIGMELVLIPPGKFLMGSPEDERDRETNEGQLEVTLTKECGHSWSASRPSSASWFGSQPVQMRAVSHRVLKLTAAFLTDRIG